MDERIIIENRTKLSMDKILPYVLKVIQQGRISNNDSQYCYVTVWGKDKITIYASKNKQSDRFVVSNA